MSVPSHDVESRRSRVPPIHREKVRDRPGKPGPLARGHAFDPVHPTSRSPRPYLDENQLGSFLGRLNFKHEVDLSIAAGIISRKEPGLKLTAEPLRGFRFRALSQLVTRIHESAECRIATSPGGPAIPVLRNSRTFPKESQRARTYADGSRTRPAFSDTANVPVSNSPYGPRIRNLDTARPVEP